MTTLFYLTNEQISTIKQYFPKSRGKARVSDKKVISGIIYILKNGLRWLDAPKAYGPHKTLYNRYIRWSKLNIWEKIFTQLASTEDLHEHLQLDSSHIKAHRTACSLKNDGKDRGLGRTKGGINSKLQLLCSHQGLPVAVLVSSGNQSDHQGAKQMQEHFCKGLKFIADAGYDSDSLKSYLRARDIEPCIKPNRTRIRNCYYDKNLYKQRHKIENIFAKIKDWRRIATRYDRNLNSFTSAVYIALIFIFYL